MNNSELRPLKWRMFALAFTALFLEMMVIRWVPSVVKLIAFYANLMLLSSFLGLGIGATLATRIKRQLMDYFPIILALDIATLFLVQGTIFGSSDGESRMATLSPTTSNNLVLFAIFALNTLLFLPIGQRMGVLFEQLPRLTAYAWDLGGSLCGTVCFGIFSLLHFSPLWGVGAVMAVCLFLSEKRRWILTVPLFIATLGLVYAATDPKAIWSPYHYITVTQTDQPGVSVSAPPANVREMRDPPIYSVSVHHFYYHYNMALDPARYTPGTAHAAEVEAISRYFRFPYAVAPGRERVLILGGGGGGDVQGALFSGVKHVDAVEIDPGVVAISRRFNPENPYDNPRVSVHIDDARAYLSRAEKGYDAVVYGLLDSHALFTSMNNVRLDGYVYTVEGVRKSFDLIKDDGVLFLAFAIERDWLLPKLYCLVAEATGREPVMYVLNRTVVLCVPKNPAFRFPPSVYQLQRTVFDQPPKQVAVPTDDWPFLYLRERGVPRDYAITIGVLLLVSITAIVGLRGRAFRTGDTQFLLLGMGFMMLETKSIGDCTLYFGATWLVTVIVVSGVLLMVMASNLVAERLKGFSLWMYAPLLLTLLLLLLVPREAILALPSSARLAWALLAVPLPVFFAGLIFSTLFRMTTTPSAAFGANLVGAMIGGFCEYLSMSVGNFRVSLLVLSAYLLSLLIHLLSRRFKSPGPAPA